MRRGLCVLLGIMAMTYILVQSKARPKSAPSGVWTAPGGGGGFAAPDLLLVTFEDGTTGALSTCTMSIDATDGAAGSSKCISYANPGDTSAKQVDYFPTGFSQRKLYSAFWLQHTAHPNDVEKLFRFHRADSFAEVGTLTRIGVL